MARRSYRPRGGRRTLEDSFRRYLWLSPRKSRKRGKDKDKDDGGVPVEPNKPNTLSGGAAAELEFDD